MALIAGGYSLYWSPGAAYGARFWHPMLLVLPIGVAVAFLRAQDRWAPQTPAWVPGLLLALACTAGGSRLLPELGDRYWCVDGQVAEYLESEGITEGVILVQGEGRRAQSWENLNFQIACDPMLEAGDVIQLMNPTQSQGGLQVRHALTDPDERRMYLEQYQPGVPSWLLRHDIALDQRSMENLHNSEDLEGL